MSVRWKELKTDILYRVMARTQPVLSTLQHRSLNATLRALGAAHVTRIPSWTKVCELETLFSLALNSPRGAVALEIGSYLGASSCYLAAGLKHRSGRLFCVDTWENQTMPEGIRDTFAEFRQNTAPFAAQITTIRKRSDKLKERDVLTPLDLVFIDGDHSFDAVARDFAIASEWVRVGGIIAFHDVGNPDYPGVSRVVGDAIASGDWIPVGGCRTLVWLRKSKSSSRYSLNLGADV